MFLKNLMNYVFWKFIDEFVVVSIEDILIHSRTESEHKKHIELVLKELRENKIYAKLTKCFFMRNKVEYLGHIISENGIQMNQKKVEAVMNWEEPTSVKQMQSFLGFCNYYRKFVKKFWNNCRSIDNFNKKGCQIPMEFGMPRGI